MSPEERQMLRLKLPELMKKIGALTWEERQRLKRVAGPGFIVGMAHRHEADCLLDRSQRPSLLLCTGLMTMKIVGTRPEEIWNRDPGCWHVLPCEEVPPTFFGISDFWVPSALLHEGEE